MSYYDAKNHTFYATQNDFYKLTDMFSSVAKDAPYEIRGLLLLTSKQAKQIDKQKRNMKYLK